MLFMVVERIMMMIVTVLTMMMMTMTMTMMIMMSMILLMVMLIMVQCSIVVAGAASGGNKVDRPAHPHTGRRMVMVMMMREREKVSEMALFRFCVLTHIALVFRKAHQLRKYREILLQYVGSEKERKPLAPIDLHWSFSCPKSQLKLLQVRYLFSVNIVEYLIFSA